MLCPSERIARRAYTEAPEAMARHVAPSESLAMFDAHVAGRLSGARPRR